MRTTTMMLKLRAMVSRAVKPAALLVFPAVFAVTFFNCAPTAKEASATANNAQTAADAQAAPDVQSGGIDSGPTAPMRAAYRSGDFRTVDSLFAALNVPGVPDSIKCHAYYLMGQTFLRRDDLRDARRFFTMIPNKHPDYVFAYHAAADVNSMSDNRQAAIDALKLVVGVKPKNNAQAEIINRSYLFLGFIYHENRTLDAAVAALRKVPKSSRHYQDAQLGLGWIAQEERQWSDSFNAGAEVVNTAADPFLKSEGNLLQAYALAMQKDYAQAVDLLNTAAGRLSSYSGPSDSEIAARRNEYNEYEGQLFFSRDFDIVLDDITFALQKFRRLANSPNTQNNEQ